MSDILLLINLPFTHHHRHSVGDGYHSSSLLYLFLLLSSRSFPDTSTIDSICIFAVSKWSSRSLDIHSPELPEFLPAGEPIFLSLDRVDILPVVPVSEEETKKS